jgi:hypothetical protein
MIKLKQIMNIVRDQLKTLIKRIALYLFINSKIKGTTYGKIINKFNLKHN